MAVTNEPTTLVCLFHHEDQAQAALQDLVREGIPETSISLLDGATYNSTDHTQAGPSWAELGVPEEDQKHLTEGLRAGGTIITVSAMSDQGAQVEKIFKQNRAEKIDEIEREDRGFAAGLLASGSTASSIPIVEEELVVGKRTVDQGGVRVYRRVVEIPVEQTVNLHEERVNVARRAVDRPVTDGDLAFQGDRIIELTETAEEAVVTKNARVIEEVLVGKDVSQRTEHIQDTVRKTQVEVEEIAPEIDRVPTKNRI